MTKPMTKPITATSHRRFRSQIPRSCCERILSPAQFGWACACAELALKSNNVGTAGLELKCSVTDLVRSPSKMLGAKVRGYASELDEIARVFYALSSSQLNILSSTYVLLAETFTVVGAQEHQDAAALMSKMQVDFAQ